MARTGTQFAKITGDYSNANIYATWQLRSQDTNEKTSTIRLRMYLTTSSNATYSSSFSSFELNDKSIKSGAYSYSTKGDHSLGYRDITVEHNEDGTFPDTELTAYASSFHFPATTETATLTSDDIPSIEVKSTIDSVANYITDDDLGVPMAVLLESTIIGSTSKLYATINNTEYLIFEESWSGGTLNKHSAIFFDEEIYSSTGEIKTDSGAIIQKYLCEKKWEDICALIPNDTSLPINFVLKTYIDDAEVGTSEVSYDFTVTNASIDYTYSFENDDLSYSLIGARDKFILGVSKPTFTINSATSNNGATIKEYKFLKLTDSEELYTTTSSSQVFTKVTVLKDVYMCQIVDSRGLFVETPYLSLGDDFYDVQIPYIEYTKPIFSKVQIERPDEVANYVNLSITGSFWKNNFGAKDNSLTVQYRYKLSNASDYTDWISVTPTIADDGTFSYSGTVENISSNLSATFEVRLVDITNTEEKLIGIAVPKGKSMFDWGEEYFSFNGDFCINDEQVPCFEETSIDENGSRTVQLMDYEFNKVYPNPYQVGDVYISSSNVDPSSRFGGTWELIDKEFTPLVGNKTDFFTRNTTNTSEVSYCAIVRAGHSIRIRINATNKVAFDDDSYVIGTLDFSKLGVTNLSYTKTVLGTVNDTSITRATFNFETGVLTNVSVIGGTSVSSGGSIVYDMEFVVTPSNMLDEACNKFYWKRTS